MRKLFFVFTLLLILSLSSCFSTSIGSLMPINNNQNTEFDYIKTVYGQSYENFYFGMSENHYTSSGVTTEAMENLRNNARLTKNQVLINVSLDHKKTWFIIPLWAQYQCSISADVIEFSNKPQTQTNKFPSKKDNNKVSFQGINNSIEIEEDEVLKEVGTYYKGYKCTILKHISDTLVLIEYIGPTGRGYSKIETTVEINSIENVE